MSERALCLMNVHVRLCTSMYAYLNPNGELAMPVDVTRTLRFCKDFITKPAVLAAVVLVATVASWAARAKELGPLEAQSLQLGEMNGVA